MTSIRYAGNFFAGTLLLAGLASAQSLAPSPARLTFTFGTTGAAEQTQQLQVAVTGGTGRTLSATASASSGGSWLAVNPGSTSNPGATVALTVTANRGTLAPGTYNGQVELAMSPATPVVVAVTMTIGSGSTTAGLTLTPSSLTLSAATGGAAVSQSVSVGAATATAFTAQATSQGGWLAVTPASGTTPAQLQVTATPGTLAAGNYTGTVNVTPTGGTATALNVTFTVGSGGGGGTSGLTVTPQSLSFSVPVNSGPSANQTLTASLQTALLTSIGAQVTTASGGNWLTVNPTSGNSPLTMAVSVNPQGLAAGTYNGTIALSVGGTTNPPVNVPVTLNVTSGSTSSQLRADPTSVTFTVAPGASRTQSQNVAVTGEGGVAVPVTAAISGGAWLTVNPSALTTPGSFQVSINAAGLTDGAYEGTLTLSSASSTVTVPIKLNVGTPGSGGGGGGSGADATGVFPSTLSFDVQSGRPLPGARWISVEGAAGGSFTAAAATTSGGSWLQVSPASGSTPGLAVARLADTVVNGLSPGTYNGTITITPSGTGATARTVNVRLNVSATAAFSASTPLLSFITSAGGPPPSPLTFTIDSTGTTALPLVVGVSVDSGAPGWLTATSAGATTPATVTLTANPAGLPAGTYTATVNVTSSQQGVSALALPVRLLVRASGTTLLTANPSQLVFSATGTAAPSPQTVTLASTAAAAAQFTATASVVSPSGGTWLTVQPAAGALPGSLTISASATGLANGEYAGTVTISSSGSAPLVIPVLFRVSGASPPAGITAAPTSLTFTQAPGGTAPAAQTVQLTAATATSFTATAATSSGGSWLSVTPASGQTPATLSVTVANSASLSVGTYSGSITVTAGSSSTTIPVTLTVGTAAASPLTATPATLSFSAAAGAANPAAQSVQIAASAANPALPFTAAATTQSGGNWLTVTPAAGTSPATIQVGVNLAGLAAGSYSGTVTLTPQGAQALTIPVTLTVTAAGGGPGTAPAVTEVVHAATQRSGTIAPGTVVFLRGTGLGPVRQALLELDAQGRVNTRLSNVRVLFDATPAPLIAVQQDAISAVAPFSLAGRSTTSVVVENGTVRSAPVTVNVAEAAPGIFSIAGTGSGQGAILNQDLTVNSSTNPAARGSIAVLYLTGDGELSPAGVDGEVASAGTPRRPMRPLQLRVGGVAVPSANILYHGPAPGLVLGVTQLNFVVPEVTPGGAVPVEVSSGTTTSSGITMAVR